MLLLVTVPLLPDPIHLLLSAFVVLVLSALSFGARGVWVSILLSVGVSPVLPLLIEVSHC